MTSLKKALLPVAALFLLATATILLLGPVLEKLGLNQGTLLTANGLLCLLNVVAILLQQKALKSANPNVFVRSVMASMMLKMILCAVAVVVYIKAFSGAGRKGTIFVAMFLYLLYLGVEVFTATKLNRQKHG